jgi:hypothetical protein
MPVFVPLLLALAAAAPPGPGVGQYGRWGAFAAARAGRCYAIAMPMGRAAGAVAVTAPPLAPRVDIRPSRTVRPGSLRASVDGRPLPLDGDATASVSGRRVLAALRTGTRLRVAARDPAGRRFRDDYPLSGLASALDAATIGCLTR